MSLVPLDRAHCDNNSVRMGMVKYLPVILCCSRTQVINRKTRLVTLKQDDHQVICVMGYALGTEQAMLS